MAGLFLLQGKTQEPAGEVQAGDIVVADVDARGIRPARADWDAFRDESGRVVTSTTGELAWHQGDGYVVVDTPRTVAVIGHTATGKTVATRACRFDVSTPFVSLILTSLDDRPMASTAHILVTALARDRQTRQPFAGLTVFAMHLDTIGGTLMGADYAYHLEQTLRSRFGPVRKGAISAAMRSVGTSTPKRSKTHAARCQ